MQTSNMPIIPSTFPAPHPLYCDIVSDGTFHLLQAQHKGVLIRRVEPTAPAHAAVGAYDILLSFDGIDISNDGTVPFRSGERISFSYLVSQVSGLSCNRGNGLCSVRGESVM
jgi:hypothetical protein